MITAPYNFVPLSEKVFFPDWADKVSHDIPFEDGESGTIGITITAKSPIFIRDHEKQEEFCQHDGKFYIPGSSVKGMIRSVLEVMSFSRITTQDKKYSFRDITNNEYKKRLMNSQKDIECGWLYREGNSWKIYELGLAKPFKETHQNIAKVLENKNVLEFPKKSFNPKTPENKYKKYSNSFDKLKTTNKKVAVFTGTINRLDDKEWLFPLPQKTDNDIVLDSKIVEAFKDAYYIGKTEESKVWKEMWGKVLKNGGSVPVFFLKADNKIEHFGLSLLYKLPYKNSIHEMIKSHNQNLEKVDLAETIFGYIKEENNSSLKGRVQFSHFIATKVEGGNDLVKAVLNSPKPTYYPNYVEQVGQKGKLNSNYNHYSTKKATIRGWKHYPLQDKEKLSDDSAKDSISTKFKPLDKETVFEGKIRYHNLKKAELGVLLSALTFHGNEEKCHHNIGMAKPLGYGEIELTLVNVEKQDEFLNTFEELMEEKENWLEATPPFDSWIESEQLVELFSIYNFQKRKNLRYQMLDNPNSEYTKYNAKQNRKEKQKNEFVGAKNAKEYLVSHSMLSSLSIKQESTPPSKKNTTIKKTVVNQQIYTMQNIAKETLSSVEEIIAFSKGLHFGQLTKESILKEPQAKDLIKRLKKAKEGNEVNATKQVDVQRGISKNKMHKALNSYWQENYNILYHRNQIREFFSDEGFITTPEDQRTPYMENRNNEEFIKLCKLINSFEFSELEEEYKEALYEYITKNRVV